jgi:hypothetical protein
MQTMKRKADRMKRTCILKSKTEEEKEMHRTSAKKSGGGSTNRPGTKEEISRLLELYGTHTPEEVAEMYGVTPIIVNVWIYSIRHHGTAAFSCKRTLDLYSPLEWKFRKLEELNTDRKDEAGENNEE